MMSDEYLDRNVGTSLSEVFPNKFNTNIAMQYYEQFSYFV